MFGFGATPQETQAESSLTSTGGFATGQGEKDISASDQFMRAILSGDATKTSQALAPQIGAAKKSAQQDIATRTQMGSRSGGNAAANAATTDKVHSDITDMIASLTGSAASTLSSTGTNLLNIGTSANEDAFQAAEATDPWSKILGLGQAAGTIAGAYFGSKRK